jgi:hypothetical protein
LADVAKKPRRVGTEGPLSLGKHHTEPGEFGVFHIWTSINL